AIASKQRLPCNLTSSQSCRVGRFGLPRAGLCDGNGTVQQAASHGQPLQLRRAPGHLRSLLWRVVERISQPVPVGGLIPVIAGLVGAVGNWGVAAVLREPADHDAAIRLAYVHNLGDTLLSLAPVLAGGLVLASGRPVFDSLVALLVAAVIVFTTIRSVVGSHKELLWPENVVCGHE